jgi:hypothetical protein
VGGMGKKPRRRRSLTADFKAEIVELCQRDTRSWPTRAGAKRAVVEYIGWYSGSRLHSSFATKARPITKQSQRKDQASSLT